MDSDSDSRLTRSLRSSRRKPMRYDSNSGGNSKSTPRGGNAISKVDTPLAPSSSQKRTANSRVHAEEIPGPSQGRIASRTIANERSGPSRGRTTKAIVNDIPIPCAIEGRTASRVITDETPGPSQRRNTRGSDETQSTSQKRPPKTNILNEEVALYQIPREEMISNGVLYCLVMENAKLPIKRTDLIRDAFHKQSANYNVVFKELADDLDEVFGIRLIGVNESKDDKKPCSTFILVSRFFNLTNNVMAVEGNDLMLNSLLLMILTTIFMNGHAIEEDSIWKIISELSLYPKNCKKREDLHRFIKTTYILPLYLKLEQLIEGPDNDVVRYRYNWGVRAETEISKYKILKFAAQHYPEKKISDFTSPYAMVMKSKDEKKLMDTDELQGLESIETSQFSSNSNSNSEDEDEDEEQSL